MLPTVPPVKASTTRLLLTETIVARYKARLRDVVEQVAGRHIVKSPLDGQSTHVRTAGAGGRRGIAGPPHSPAPAVTFPLFDFDEGDYDMLYGSKLELLMALNRHEHVTWSGPHRRWPLQDRLIVPPEQPLRIWLGTGGSPQSVLRAVELGLPMFLGILGGMSCPAFAPCDQAVASSESLPSEMMKRVRLAPTTTPCPARTRRSFPAPKRPGCARTSDRRPDAAARRRVGSQEQTRNRSSSGKRLAP